MLHVVERVAQWTWRCWQTRLFVLLVVLFLLGEGCRHLLPLWF